MHSRSRADDRTLTDDRPLRATTSSPAVPVVAVVGPTAAGKSDLAIQLAKRLGGEVVNGDSMQIYRGMDIGTAKLTAAQRRGVTHHLLDVLDVTEPATVAEFQTWARRAIVDCRTRRVVPIVVGGSALYLRAVLDDFVFPGTDPAIRARLESELTRLGSAGLHSRLAEVDADAAAAILPSNARRVVRALEVWELTGHPYQAVLPERSYVYAPTVQLGLDVPREVLDERIEARMDRMWEAGFVDEVRALEAAGLRRGRTASRALGYRQVLDFLAGECSEDEARAETVRASRRFVRRQDAWFRKDPRITWISYDDVDRVGAAERAVRSGRDDGR
jgi:tRNA dimethylallyltransferase